MKRFFTTFLMMAVFAIGFSAFAGTASGQERSYRNRERRTVVYKKPSVYRRHRNLINMAIGTGGGALLGGLIGGKKGALWGTALGAGGSALYTYKLVPKKRKYNSYYTRRY